MQQKQVEIGGRVVAISHDDGPVVYIFGYGTFEGYFLPPYVKVDEALAEIQTGYREAQGVIPELPAVLPEDTARTMLLLDHANPRIKLDNGATVWGYECWWRSAEEFDGIPKPEDFKLVEVDIEVARAQAKAVEALENVEELTPDMLQKAFKEVN